MSCLLLDAPPTYITVDNQQYEINTDFRVSIQFELLMQGDISNEVKIMLTLDLYLPEIPENVMEAYNEIVKFYSANSRHGKSEGLAGKGRSPERIYSYEYDDGYIFAAFKAYYNVDLVDIDYLHWWKFQAMFIGLPDTCEISKIMGFRAIKITEKMGKEQKAHYRKMKRIYKLPDNRSREQKEFDFADSMADFI